ncbi:MAG: hypothetical protein M1831_001730 [Alyxoria varia]|nr:MAG: hypothetical protein M1831_001730 [Alyxoria varia]
MARSSRWHWPWLLSLFYFMTARMEVVAFYVPGISIKSYAQGDPIPLFTNKIYSDTTQIQYAYNELPFICAAGTSDSEEPNSDNPHSKAKPKSKGKSKGKHSYTNLISGHRISLNLGEVLRGDRITVSDFELNMLEDVEMRLLCWKRVDKDALVRAQDIVSGGYVAEWIVDNLPGATQFVTPDRARKYYAAGFKVGFESTSPMGMPMFFINNHFTLVIRYNQAPGRDGRNGRKVIVGFEVYPKSVEIDDRDEEGLPKDIENVERGMELAPGAGRNLSDRAKGAENDDIVIPYTYSVFFREEPEVDWHNRWDMYFVNQDDTKGVHWLAIVNSLVILGLLSAVVAVVLAKTIYGDIKGQKDVLLEEGKSKHRRKPGYPSHKKRTSIEKSSGLLGSLEEDSPNNTIVDTNIPSDSDNDSIDDDVEAEHDEITARWKLVTAEVFRTPPYGHVLAPLVGSGMQLLVVAVGLGLLGCVGVINPSFRGGFMSVGVGLWVFAGVFSGYFSGRLYKSFGGTMWKRNVFVTATLVPSLLFLTTITLNLFVWTQSSSTALPFPTLLLLLLLWLAIQYPLVHLGSHYGYLRHGAYAIPANAVPSSSSSPPRPIPQPQPWYARTLPAMLLAGILPFTVVFVELLFAMRSAWVDKSGFWYVWGYVCVVGLIEVAVVVECVVLGVWLRLGCENPSHSWHTFHLGSSSSLYILAYSTYYYTFHLHIQGLVSGLLYFGYVSVGCALWGLCWGAVGYVGGSLGFVRGVVGR